MKRFLLKWVGMIPDDLELAHRCVLISLLPLTVIRYFCRQQYLVDPGSITDPNTEENWIDQLIPTMNKFVPSVNMIEGEQRSIVDTSKRSRVDSVQSVGPILAASETDIIGTLLVKVVSARGLPVKELSVSALPVSAGPFTLILPKVMVQISIVPSSICSLVYKSGAQPRGPAPVFREDFLFRGLVTLHALFPSPYLFRQISTLLGPIMALQRSLSLSYFALHFRSETKQRLSLHRRRFH